MDKSYFSGMLFRAMVAGRKTLLFQLMALGLVVGGLEGAFIVLTKTTLAGHSSMGGWSRTLLLMGVLVTARTAMQILATHVELRAVFGLVMEKRRALLAAAVDRAVPVHRQPWRGDLALALKDGLENLAQGVGAGFRCLAAGAQAAVLVPMLLLFSWKLAAAALALAVPALLASRLRAGMLAASGQGWEHSQGEIAKAAEDFAEGSETQIGNGRMGEAAAAMDLELDRHAGKSRAWETAKAVFPPALEWFFFMALAILAGLAAAYGGDSLPRETGPAGLLPFGALLVLLYRPIREWARHYPLCLMGGRAWAGLSNLEATLAGFPPRRAFAMTGGKRIRMEGIRFGYSQNPADEPANPVFTDFELELEPTELTWISGRNGSGKSTLLKLMAGVETPQAGSILLPAALRDSARPIAYLSQKAVVETDWRVWSAGYRSVNPEGWDVLDAILGLGAILAKSDNLRGLSGGERQRLCLARAFASDSAYLLLDEPTTWLSAEDRERIMGDLLSFWRAWPPGPRSRKEGPRGAAIVSHEPFLGEFCSRTVRLGKMESVRI